MVSGLVRFAAGLFAFALAYAAADALWLGVGRFRFGIGLIESVTMVPPLAALLVVEYRTRGWTAPDRATLSLAIVAVTATFLFLWLRYSAWSITLTQRLFGQYTHIAGAQTPLGDVLSATEIGIEMAIALAATWLFRPRRNG